MKIFVDTNGSVFLLGNTVSELQKASLAIIQYTRNTYPSTPLKINPPAILENKFCAEDFRKENAQAFPDVMARFQSDYQRHWTPKTEDEASDFTEFSLKSKIVDRCRRYYKKAEGILNQKYDYALPLDEILPSAVKTTFDLSHRYQAGAGFRNLNCHAATRIASGIFPSRTEGYPAGISKKNYCKESLQAITLTELSPGDIISFDTQNHSIVYLDEDLCISANGTQALMEIYSISSVVKTYYPDDTLYTSLHGLSSTISCYRKAATIQYPENMMTLLRENAFLLMDSSLCYGQIGDIISHKAKKLAQSLVFECLEDEKASTQLKRCYLRLLHSDDIYCLPRQQLEVMHDIFHAQEKYHLSHEQALMIFKNPLLWSNLAFIFTEKGQKALAEKQISIDDVLNEEVQSLAKKIRPLTTSDVIYQGFFAAPRNEVFSSQRDISYTALLFTWITKLYAAVISDIWITYQYILNQQDEEKREPYSCRIW